MENVPLHTVVKPFTTQLSAALRCEPHPPAQILGLQRRDSGLRADLHAETPTSRTSHELRTIHAKEKKKKIKREEGLRSSAPAR